MSLSAFVSPKFRTSPRYRWLVLVMGIGAVASTSMIGHGLPVVGPMLQAEYQLTVQQLGWALGAISLGFCLAGVPWGLFADRWGERQILLWGLFSTSSILIATALFLSVYRGDSFFVIFATCLFLIGSASAGVIGASGKAVMSWFQDRDRGLAMSIRQAAVPLGGAIGALLLPWFAVMGGFEFVFAMLALVCFCAALAIWFLLFEAPLSRIALPTLSVDMSVHYSSLMCWEVWRFVVVSILLTVPQCIVISLSAVYLVQVHQANLFLISGAILIVQIGGAMARIWSGHWTDLRGNRPRYLRNISGLTAISCILVAVATANHAMTLAVVGLVISGLLASAWQGVAYTEIAIIAGPRHTGAVLGLVTTMIYVAVIATLTLTPMLLLISSWVWVWTVAGFCALAAVPLTLKRQFAAAI